MDNVRSKYGSLFEDHILIYSRMAVDRHWVLVVLNAGTASSDLSKKFKSAPGRGGGCRQPPMYFHYGICEII